MDKDVKLEEGLELLGILGDDYCDDLGCSAAHMVMADACDECRAGRVQDAGFRKAENVRKEVVKEIHDRLRRALEKRSKTAKERGEKFVTIEILDAELSIDEIAYENGVEVDA